jgi:alkyl hydroperoxide reductase subunit AhpF
MTSAAPAVVTVVTARGCHLCEDATQALAALGQVCPLTVQEVAAHSPAGQALVLEHGTGIYPLVLVDGVFFSAGRLPRRKLARQLTPHAAAGAR